MGDEPEGPADVEAALGTAQQPRGLGVGLTLCGPLGRPPGGEHSQW